METGCRHRRQRRARVRHDRPEILDPEEGQRHDNVITDRVGKGIKVVSTREQRLLRSEPSLPRTNESLHPRAQSCTTPHLLA